MGKKIIPAVEKIVLRRGIDHIGVSICCIVHNGSGKILLMKRSVGARDEHGRWDIVGGALEFGETIDDAIERELNEELCTKPLNVIFLNAFEAHRVHQEDKTHWVGLLHSVLVDPSTVKLGEPDKFDEIGWFGASDLPSPLHSQFPKVLKTAKEIGIII